jgi:hypothetical protein
LPKKDEPMQNPENPQNDLEIKVVTISKSKKRILLTLLICLILGCLGGISYGIYYAVDYYSLKTIVKPATKIIFEDGSTVQSTPIEIIDKNVVADNLNVKAVVMSTLASNDKRLMQENSEASSHSIYVYHE